MRLRDEAEKGRLLELHRQALPQHVVKYGIAGVVREFGEDNLALVMEPGRTVCVEVRGNQDREDNSSGEAYHLAVFACGYRLPRIRVPLQPSEVGANLRCVLIPELPCTFSRHFETIRCNSGGRPALSRAPGASGAPAAIS